MGVEVAPDRRRHLQELLHEQPYGAVDHQHAVHRPVRAQNGASHGVRGHDRAGGGTRTPCLSTRNSGTSSNIAGASVPSAATTPSCTTCTGEFELRCVVSTYASRGARTRRARALMYEALRGRAPPIGTCAARCGSCVTRVGPADDAHPRLNDARAAAQHRHEPQVRRRAGPERRCARPWRRCVRLERRRSCPEHRCARSRLRDLRPHIALVEKVDLDLADDHRLHIVKVDDFDLVQFVMTVRKVAPPPSLGTYWTIDARPLRHSGPCPTRFTGSPRCSPSSTPCS